MKELANHVAQLIGLKAEDLLTRGRYKGLVEGRSLLCYWAVRELGLSTTELARRIGISQPAVSYSVRRGEKIAREENLASFPK